MNDDIGPMDLANLLSALGEDIRMLAEAGKELTEIAMEQDRRIHALEAEAAADRARLELIVEQIKVSSDAWSKSLREIHARINKWCPPVDGGDR